MTASCLLGSWMLESWGTHRLRRGSISCTQMLWLTMEHGTAVGHTLHPSPSLLRLLALALARSTLSDSSRRGLHRPHSAAAGTTPPPATRSFPSRTAARQDMRPPVSDRSQLPSRHPEQDAACACTHSHYSHGHAHTRRPRHMLMVHEALLPATPTCTHGVSRGSCTPPIPPKAHAPT